MLPDFTKLFFESKREPIEYKGAELHLADKFPVSNGDKLLICIESTDSKRPQGLSVSIEGSCEIQGTLYKKGKKIKPYFWEDSEVLDPKNIEIIIFTKKDFVWIQNICEVDYSYLITDEFGAPLEIHKKRIDSGYNGAAMIIEEIENGKRYKCSDTSAEDKEFPFNDIIFTVQKMNNNASFA